MGRIGGAPQAADQGRTATVEAVSTRGQSLRRAPDQRELGGSRSPQPQEVVAVLTTRVRLEEKLLFAALERRGIPYLQLRDAELLMRLDAPQRYRLVLMRSLSQTRRLAAARLFEAWGVLVVNSAAVLATCDDKIATAAALVRAGVPVPETAVALAPSAGVEAIRSVGYPAVTKPVNGSWGRLLAKVNDDDAAEAVIAHKAQLASAPQRVILAQRYVGDGGDVRVIVIGGKVVGAIRRRGPGWVASIARGAEAEPLPVSEELERLALAAAEAVGGAAAAVAVDLLETSTGELLVSEVNSTIEFGGFMAATGIDVADRVVAHVLEFVPW